MNGFTFYKDYYNLIDTLPNKEDKKEIFTAILDYMFKNEEPNLDGHNQAIFNTLKHQLDVSKNNSGRGGKTTQKQPKQNRKVTDRQTDLVTDLETDLVTDKKTVRHNKTSISNFLFLFSNLYISNLNNKNNINKLLEEYLELRVSKKYTLNETVVTRLINKLNKYGTTDDDKIEIITNAINGAWKDFYPLEHRERKPEWFDKDIKGTQASEEKVNQMKEMLKEYGGD